MKETCQQGVIGWRRATSCKLPRKKSIDRSSSREGKHCERKNSFDCVNVASYSETPEKFRQHLKTRPARNSFRKLTGPCGEFDRPESSMHGKPRCRSAREEPHLIQITYLTGHTSERETGWFGIVERVHGTFQTPCQRNDTVSDFLKFMQQTLKEIQGHLLERRIKDNW